MQYRNVTVRGLQFSALAASLLLAACVGPGVTGNDRGGIIPWSEANRIAARDLAYEHCARYGTVARLTGIDPRYGGYISFRCEYDRRFSPRH